MRKVTEFETRDGTRHASKSAAAKHDLRLAIADRIADLMAGGGDASAIVGDLLTRYEIKPLKVAKLKRSVAANSDEPEGQVA